MKSYFFAILEVEHDGYASPEELCRGLGLALDDSDLEITMKVEDGTTVMITMTECIGVDHCQPEQIEDLLAARKEQQNGDE